MISRRRVLQLGRWVVVAAVVASCSGPGDSVETTSNGPLGTMTDALDVTSPPPPETTARASPSTSVLGREPRSVTTDTAVAAPTAKAGSTSSPTSGADAPTTTAAAEQPTSESSTTVADPGPDDTTTTTQTAAHGSTIAAPPSTTVRSSSTTHVSSTSTSPATTLAATGLPAGYVALEGSNQFTVFLGGSPREQEPCGSQQRVTAQLGSQYFDRAVAGATVDACVVVPDAVVENGVVVAGGISAVTFTNASGTVRQPIGGPRTCAREGVVTGEPVCYSVGKILPGAGDVGTWTITVERADGYAPMTVALPVTDFGRPTVVGGLLSGFPPGTRPRLTAVFLGRSYGQRDDGTIGRDADPSARATTTIDGPLIGSDGTAAWTPPFLENPVGLVPPGSLGVSWDPPCFVASLLSDCGLYFRT